MKHIKIAKSMFWTYIVYSEEFDKYFIGFGSDFEGGLATYNHPKNKRYTKRFQPWWSYAGLLNIYRGYKSFELILNPGNIWYDSFMLRIRIISF